MRGKSFAPILALAALAAPASAQQTETPPCSAAEHRQFDFWIGEWEVVNPQGRVAGTNTIEPILNGCALRESWRGAGGGTGTSLNIYDAARGRWHQTWVDASGMLLQIEGRIVDGAMVLEGETVAQNGDVARNRITWTPLANGDVRQHWEVSSDGGTTWRTVFDGRYRRKP